MSPRTKTQNIQIKNERREQLLRAALEVFARRGLAATKVNDIAEAAKLSNGLVYHYFDSKEDIFVELVSMAVDQAAETLRKIDALPVEPLVKLQMFSEQAINSIFETEDSAFYFLLMVQAHVSDVNPAEVQEIIKAHHVHNQIVTKIIRDGQQKGSIPEGNAEDFTMFFLAMIQGLAQYKIALGEQCQKPDSELFMRMFSK